MAHGRGKTTIDFGPATAPTAQASRVVTGIAGLTAGGQAEAWLRGVATDDHSVDEVVVHGPRVLAVVTGTGEITIRADAGGTGGLDYGEYAVNYVWIDEYDAVDAYYSSPGGAGDYAEASTNVAARVLVPLGAPADCTFACWARATTSWGDLFRVDDGAGGGPGWTSYNDGDPAMGLVDDAGNEDVTGYFTSPATATWVRVAYVLAAGVTLKTYVDGVEADSQSVVGWDPVTLGAVRFRLFKSLSGFATDQRNIIIIDRALTANEIADLYAAGPTHHPLRATGTHWAAGQSIPVIWCTPAAAGRVANSGDGGVCDLVLNGSVTSEEDA